MSELREDPRVETRPQCSSPAGNSRGQREAFTAERARLPEASPPVGPGEILDTGLLYEDLKLLRMLDKVPFLAKNLRMELGVSSGCRPGN